MERAFEVISHDEPDEDAALLAACSCRGYWFTGDLERCGERAEIALDIAEAHGFAEAARGRPPREVGGRLQPRASRGVGSAHAARRSSWRSSTTCRTRPAPRTSSSPTRSSEATGTPRRARVPERVPRARPQSGGFARTSGRPSPSMTYPLCDARPLGRGARADRGADRGAHTLGRRAAEPARVPARDPPGARRHRTSARDLRSLRPPRRLDRPAGSRFAAGGPCFAEAGRGALQRRDRRRRGRDRGGEHARLRPRRP